MLVLESGLKSIEKRKLSTCLPKDLCVHDLGRRLHEGFSTAHDLIIASREREKRVGRWAQRKEYLHKPARMLDITVHSFVMRGTIQTRDSAQYGIPRIGDRNAM